ncbi:hypothetical protein TpMuguga_03g00501 [Theileria parva strain Muguga]|uniref:uncharacterized protein n=1 Tax=Theileria parva strain Muguga TaxID=333668 RepID=UPI001C6175C9|nr:uncharacterized protein TpMuguga_03g00501 [Theileria parva strain Muguga]EAN31246.2 hypothetical protein TpMuguga_03g00501 [Theileria parva strain Muguga]
MEEHLSSLGKLLSDYGSANVPFVSSKLNLSVEESKELFKQYVSKNEDYSILYTVQYNTDEDNINLSIVSGEELQELSSKYPNLQSSVYGVSSCTENLQDAYKNMFFTFLELSKEEMLRCQDTNELYIPGFVNLRVSNIKVRDFGKSILSQPSVKVQEVKKEPVKVQEVKREPVKVSKAEHVKTELDQYKMDSESRKPKKHEEQKEDVSLFKSDSFDEPIEVEDSDTSPESREKKRKEAVSDKEDKAQLEHKRPRLKRKTKNETDTKVEQKITIYEPKIELVKKSESPKTTKVMEKVCKKSSYIENGYFVVEESEDFVEVVKETKQTAEKQSSSVNSSRPNTTDDGVKKSLNGKYGFTNKSLEPKKLNQVSIMSFFKKQ